MKLLNRMPHAVARDDRKPGLVVIIVALSLALSAILAVPARAVQRADTLAVTRVGRYRLQSNPWVNLHQRLLNEARSRTAPPATLFAGDLDKWRKVIETYTAFLGKRSPIFDNELIQLNAALSKTTTNRLPGSIPIAASKALETAMPLYRSGQWM